MNVRIDRREAAGRGQAAAIECFNLGNHHRVRAEPHAALELYDRAAALDPGYEKYAHYWRERANVLFFAARLDEQSHAYDMRDTAFRRLFEEAIDAYRRAVKMGDDPWDQALLADTLLHAGRYEEAAAGFTAYLESRGEWLDPADGEWYLKTLVLPEIVDRRGQRRQERRLREAEAMAGGEPAEDTPAGRRELCERALELDALSPLAWFNLGQALRQEDRIDEAATAYLAAGLFRTSTSRPGAASSCTTLSAATSTCCRSCSPPARCSPAGSWCRLSASSPDSSHPSFRKTSS